MKILHTVESYHPSVGGMQEVVKQLSERLVALGHQVTVVTRKNPERKFTEFNGVKIKDFEIGGNTVNGIEGDEEGYRNYLLNSDFDIVTFFAAQQWATDVALPILDQIKGKKVSVPTGYSGLYNPQYKTYFENMKVWIRGYDMNVYLSDDYRDINFARENKIAKTIIIPNGAAADEFLPDNGISIRKKLNIPETNFLILLVGGYSGAKGHKEAAKIFLRSKLKNATLLMIGNKYEYFRRQYIKEPLFGLLRFLKLGSSKQIIFGHYTRPETVSAYKEADLFLFPSNIECSPIVLFEAMASKTPFLTTDVGNSPEIIQWSGGGMLLPTSKDNRGYSHAKISGSVKIVNELFANKQKRDELAKKGFEAWQQKFSWEIIAKKYEELYKSLIK
jgi:glycosyltransferase involved in cell wall biosynthesis